MRLHNIVPLFEHKEFLTETGLELKQLRKHGGKYFDTLISKIQNGVALDVAPPVQKQYPDGVIVDPKIVPSLIQAFYPGGNKNNAATDAGNNVQVANPAIFKTPIATLNGPPIAFGNITKTRDFKSGSGINMGIMAEGILGAAITAKFVKKGAEISMIDIGDIFEGMDPQPIESDKRSTAVMGTYVGQITHDNGVVDDLTFVLKLSKNEFSPLVVSIKTREALDPKVMSLIRSAIMYVNSAQEGIEAAVQTITESSNHNVIEVVSDGVSDNKGTKADLRLRINGETIKLVSLKAMGVRQFGQISGHQFENFNNFINDIFDVDIKSHAKRFTVGSGPEVAEANHKIMIDIYKNDIEPKVTKQLESGPKGEYAFIDKLTKGIVKHATGDSDIDLVKFDRALTGGFKVLKVNHETLQEMKNTKFHVQVVPDRATLRIYGQTTNPDLLDKLGTTEPVMLLQLRSVLQSTAGYVRNILEMGDLLEAVTTVEQSVKEPIISKKQLAKIKDLAVGKITKSGERDVRNTKVGDRIALGRVKKK